MDERIKELVAVGASAAVNCHPCMEFHLAECDRLGLDREEVRAAMETGLAVSRGAAAKSRDKLAALLGPKPDTTPEASVGCGCGG